jgi:arylsulfatase A-like enzyme
VWIVVDSWRWDHADVYRPEAALTPFLRLRVQNACVFQRAYAPSSWTLPSVASLFMGVYPSRHGVVQFSSSLPPGRPTVGELLSAAGYRGAAFSANRLVRATAGFGRGLGHFVVPPKRNRPKARASELLEAADNWLRAQARESEAPLFLYLHLMEPHVLYAPSNAVLAEILPRFGDPQALRDTIADLVRGERWKHPDDAARLAIRALYAAEVMEADAALERTFAILEHHGLLANALVVLTADHGEELFERGMLGHGLTLSEEVIRVPLILWLPGQTERRDVAAPVSLVDILPTSLRVAGVPVPSGLDGTSLAACGPKRTFAERWLPWLRRAAALSEERWIVSELLPHELSGSQILDRAAVIQGKQKLLVRSDGTLQAVRLGDAPGQESEASADAPEYRTLVHQWQTYQQYALQTGATPSPPPTPDAAVRERMRALGYVD